MPIQNELVDVPRKKEYIIAYLLEPLTEDTNFGRWPLHITLIPWFEIDKSDKAKNVVRKISSSHKPFSTTVGEKALFGSDHNIEVYVVKEKQPLRTLHNALVTELKAAGANFLDIKYMNDNYNPHITKKSYANVQPGYQLKISKIHLIEAPIGNRLTRLKKVVAVGNLR